MKNIFPICILLLSVASCQSKKGFHINGTVKNKKEGTIYVANLLTEKQDTLQLKDGKFSLSGIADEPTPFNIFSPELLPVQIIFYADQGNTDIEFTANEASSMVVKSCETQKEYERFTGLTKPLLKQFDSIQMLAMAGKIEQQEVQNAALTIQNKYEQANLEFVKQNPGSYVSALVAYEYFRQKTQLSVEEKKSYMNQLDSKIQESHFGKKMTELIHADEITAIGKPAPTFTLEDVNGKKVSLSSFKGKYVLIDFWASWCAPCRAENPNVVAAYNKFKNKNFTILGVSLDENKKQWLAAIAKDNLKWKHVSDLAGWNSLAVGLYNIKSIPSNFLIDPEGKIIAKNLQGVELENQLNNLLK